MTFYEISFYFVIYSVVGWIIEVIFHASVKGNITNRGFLNGPVCPVYGFGVIAVLIIYHAIGSDNFFIVFLEGILLTTSIELFAGWILDKFFHARWWDYSSMPLNFKGYICLAFSIIWGLAIVFALKLCHPMIKKIFITYIPVKIGIPFLILAYIVFIIDTFLTVAALIGLNKKLKELDDISNRIRHQSDKLSTSIGEHSLKTTQAIETGIVKAELAKYELREASIEKLSELEDKYNEILNNITKHKILGTGHIIKAFPNATHHLYRDIFEELQKKIGK